MMRQKSALTEPSVYVIAGPNGAGKTTFATEFLPDFVDCREFLNADLIAAGLSPFAPESQNLRAGRLLLERIADLSAARENFSFETTLSGRTHARLLHELKATGYRVVLFFLWLPKADLAVHRVANRVRQGGHAVPETGVRRRYYFGIRNFFDLYAPAANTWWVYNAWELPPIPFAFAEGGQRGLLRPDLFDQFAHSAEGTDR